jgi:hypothetical protein
VLLLALICFLLPFATVSCALPEGYGHAKPGATTEYSGVVLAIGASPPVKPEFQRPPEQWEPDRLAPQPLLLTALMLVLTALAAAVVLARARARRRRAFVAVLAGLAALFLLAGQAVVVDHLAAAVAAQSTLPAGKTAKDFVGTGIGFWLALVLLSVLALGNLAALAQRGSARATRSAAASI